MNFMKNYWVILLVLCFSSNSYSQVTGKWRITKCYPEVSGLDKADLKRLQDGCMGKVVHIDSSGVRMMDSYLPGRFSDSVKVYRVIDNSQVADSLRNYLRFFCQETEYVGAVTKQTIHYIDGSYKNKTVDVLAFRCRGDKSINCLSLLLLDKNTIGLCIPGDGLYCLKRLKTANASSKTPN